MTRSIVSAPEKKSVAKTLQLPPPGTHFFSDHPWPFPFQMLELKVAPQEKWGDDTVGAIKFFLETVKILLMQFHVVFWDQKNRSFSYVKQMWRPVLAPDLTVVTKDLKQGLQGYRDITRNSYQILLLILSEYKRLVNLWFSDD